MDTSETYIKMCEKAEEIQAQVGRTHIGGEDYCCWDGKICLGLPPIQGFEISEPDYKPTEHGGTIWLPRQDQLQEMVLLQFKNNMWVMLSNFRRMHPLDNHGITSMEQLWLAFVMKEKYNKVWDGNGWSR